jgi:NAD(P)-dependent dehydrogenase (short-subunit alcohol dehydrogenase family)
MGMADVTPELLTNTLTVNSIGAFLVTQQLRKEGLIGGSTPTTVVYTSSSLGSIALTGPFSATKMYAYR